MADLFYGADVAQLRQLSQTFSRQAGVLSGIADAVSGGVQGAAWVGPVALKFKATWSQVHSPSLRAVVEMLQAQAKVLGTQADEQDQASQASAASTIRLHAVPVVGVGGGIVKAKHESVLDGAKSFFDGIGKDISGAWKAGTDWLGDKASTAFHWVGDKVDAAGNWIVNTANGVGSWLGGKAEGVANWIGDKASGVGDWIATKTTQAGDWLDKNLGGVMDWYDSIQLHINTGIGILDGTVNFLGNVGKGIVFGPVDTGVNILQRVANAWKTPDGHNYTVKDGFHDALVSTADFGLTLFTPFKGLGKFGEGVVNTSITDGMDALFGN